MDNSANCKALEPGISITSYMGSFQSFFPPNISGAKNLLGFCQGGCSEYLGLRFFYTILKTQKCTEIVVNSISVKLNTSKNVFLFYHISLKGLSSSKPVALQIHQYMHVFGLWIYLDSSGKKCKLHTPGKDNLPTDQSHDLLLRRSY